MKKLIVITGCSGGGKSTLLTELKKSGYQVVPEVGREIVQEQIQTNGNITPWENPIAFCELAIERSIENYKKAAKSGDVIFFDRCFLDGISYYQTLSVDDSKKYDDLIGELRFYQTVLMTPPWPEIYCQDDERKHSFEEAVIEYERLMKFYPMYGYQVIEIPKSRLEERLRFIISIIT